MTRATIVLSLCFVTACTSPGAEETGGGATSAGATTGGETTGDEPTGITTGPALPDGCDVLVLGAEDGAAGLQAAIDASTPGTTICLRGQFAGTATIGAMNAVDLTLRGVDAGEGIGAGAVIDFGRTGGAPGLRFESVNGLTIENVSVIGTQGDGVVVSGGEDVTLRRVKVGWDGPNSGAELFAIRADNLTQVLVDECEASGGRDAGIFVQQSEAVIVRGSLAYANVSGIEIENCAGADVHDNEAHDNVIGLFVLDLPDTPFGNGGDVLVRDNHSHDNNAENFAEPGSVVASIPEGIGALVLATDRVELRGNTIAGNATSGALIVSFAVVELLSGMSHDDPDYDGYPQTVEIHDNMFTGNGTMPAMLLAQVFMLEQGPAILWDGAFDEMLPDPAFGLCVRGNGDADFLNLDALHGGADKSTDLAPHDCDHPDVPAVDPG